MDVSSQFSGRLLIQQTALLRATSEKIYLGRLHANYNYVAKHGRVSTLHGKNIMGGVARVDIHAYVHCECNEQ